MAGKRQSIVFITTKKEDTPIIIHRRTASNSGFTPTFLIMDKESPAQMKNRVTTRAFLEM